MLPFESLGNVSCSHSITTVAASVAVSAQYTNVTDNKQTPHDGTGRAYAGVARQKKTSDRRIMRFTSSVAQGLFVFWYQVL